MLSFREKVSLIFGLLMISANLFGLSKNPWADSVLLALKSNEGYSYAYKVKQCDTLLYLFNTDSDPCRWIEAITMKSTYQLNIGKINEALKSINLANSKYKAGACKNSSLLPAIYLAYTIIYVDLNEIEKAKHYVNQGIKSCNPELNENKNLIRLYSCKGNLFSTMDSQLYYFNKGYNLALKTGDLQLQEFLLNDIGTIYAIAGDFDQARPYFEKALIIGRKRKAYSSMSNLFNNLAGITSDVKLVSIYLDSSIYYAQLKGNLEDIQTAYQNSALFNYENRFYQKGYDFLWKSMELKDSLFNRDKINAFADMEQKYESELKEQEIELLNQQNELAKVKASRSLGINIGLASALLGILFVTYAFYSQSKKKEKLNIALQKEKQKSDDLLLNILPEEIASELKQSGQSAARLYNHVTVLFTDFVNFTGLSEQMSPTELVAEIHRNFTAFDAIIEKHGLEKIKTIGDAYLAVCGLPIESEDHAKRVVKAALEINAFMHANKGKFQIRIGIHSGPVVAGIVGVKKYAYDIWGDTVNTASRMESTSEAGKINISVATYELIKDEFTFAYRGKINAKNKGEVDMWFVEG